MDTNFTEAQKMSHFNKIVAMYRETVRSAIGEQAARRFDSAPDIQLARRMIDESEVTNLGVPEERRDSNSSGSSTTIPVPNPEPKGD